MATFVIEGTVSELKMSDTMCSFKICGTEGYSIRQKKGNDYICLNVLCPPSQTAEDSKKPRGAIVIGKEKNWMLNKDSVFINLIACAVISGKKVLFEFEASERDNYEVEISGKLFKFISITLLAD